MKTNTIKSVKPLLVAAVVLGTITARASWTVQGPSDLYVTPGESGSSTYIFTPTTTPPAFGIIVSQTSSYQPEGTSANLAFGANAPITTYLPAISPIGDTVYANTPFSIVVDWTISSNPAYQGEEFSASYSIDTDAYGNAGAAQNINFTIEAAPEPAQTVAGALLLGSGLVVIAGRRLLKKTPASV